MWQQFVAAFNAVADAVGEWSERKGWHDDDPARRVHSDVPTRESALTYHDLAKLGLMVTEISEAIEGRRHGDPPSDKIPEFTAQEEELADTIIRIMDYATSRELRVAEALVAKMAYNEGRPYKHGKQA
jgi:NTP pyrophosphatase (non-canonical NTP hydrolase)